jgi:cell division protein FtsA
LASGEAVLNPEERETGVALMDFGGGTTDLAIFGGDSIQHTGVLALGGNNLTTDLAMGMRTPLKEAEDIKKRSGCCLISMIGKDEVVEVLGVGSDKPRRIRRRVLAEILEPRVEEILNLIQMDLQGSTSGDQSAARSVVLTGGSSLLEGLTEMAEQVFNLPARRGYPMGVGGLNDVVNNPMCATAVGLILYGARNRSEKKFRIRDVNIFNRITARMRRWFKDIV